MKLDVGCGARPSGDVNCDLYVRDVCNHRDTGVENVLPVHSIPNFVCCDALHLPFRDNAFSVVFCSQLIEHFASPMSLFRELVRVSCERVIVETVHRLGESFSSGRTHSKRWYKQHHISKFNFRWLFQAGIACGCKVVRDYVLDWYYFPNSYFTLFRVPHAIGVEFKKN
jgi:ubiquinone/menaquinone biosynthesis C-methylase UbiE